MTLAEFHDTIGLLDKGLGKLGEPASTSRGSAQPERWSLLGEEVSLPAAVLYESRLEHNLRWMQRFVDTYGMKLAPHGKTTMAPALFRRQLAAGAWGITVATAQQALVAARHGAPRILMANQLVGRRNCEIVAELLAAADHVEFFCLIDSVSGAEKLNPFFAERGQTLHVLLELGVDGGRSGVRNAEQANALLRAVAQSPALRLSGVELYEGVASDEPAVRALLERAVGLARELAAGQLLRRSPAILSGAGSAWYDVVAEEFARAELGSAFEMVLRPGCYLTHDVGAYRAAQSAILQRNSVARAMQSGLLPALQIWAYVHSLPEPGRAIIGLGKRDAAFDAGYPEPALYYRPGANGQPAPTPAHWTIEKMMDQHAYLQIAPGDELAVGDMLAFDVAHPCLTFDKWRALVVVDDDFRVREIVKTYF